MRRCVCPPPSPVRAGEGGPGLHVRAGREGAVRDGRRLRGGPRTAPDASGPLLRARPLRRHGQHGRQGAALLHPGGELQR